MRKLSAVAFVIITIMISSVPPAQPCSIVHGVRVQPANVEKTFRGLISEERDSGRVGENRLDDSVLAG